MKRLLILCSLFFAFVNAQTKIQIQGKVLNESSNPMPYVNVYIKGSTEGTVTDENGQYKFVTKESGKFILVASMMGYEKFEEELYAGSEQIIERVIKLNPKVIELKSAVVTGSSFSSERGKGLVVSKIDVYTTPGGAADIFQSLKKLPGLTQVSESAQLYVRGGDPNETVTMIDKAAIYHPYTFESGQGGLFSNLNTGSVKNLYFSSGGFSVKYGNVLSGVLDVETENVPETDNYALGISMANLDFSTQIPLIEEKLGFRMNAQKTYTKLLMELNGNKRDFTLLPTSENVTASLTYKYSKTGKIKVFGNLAADEQGVKVERAEFNGIFLGESNSNFFNISHSDLLFNKMVIKNSLSMNTYNNDYQFGVIDINIKDKTSQFRSDLEFQLSQDYRLLGGVEFSSRNVSYVGKIPENDYDNRPGTESIILNNSIPVNKFGTYLEGEIINIFGIKNLFVVGGFRYDKFAEQKVEWIDPRMTLGYKLSEKSSIKFGTGIFHQIPDVRLYSPEDGNPDLKAMKAIHYVVSYDHSFNENNSLKIETYYKKYSGLPLENELLNYTNEGEGYAKGFDFIFKGTLPLDIDGWISYGYIDTKRNWMDYDEYRRSDFDITHNLNLVMKYNILPVLQVGVSYKIASGRPFTPVTGAEYLEKEKIYKPIFGATNSESYPVYNRLDLRLTYFSVLFNNKFSIMYIEALNILNIKNLHAYRYNNDYTEKYKIPSYFGSRTIVVGVNISY